MIDYPCEMIISGYKVVIDNTRLLLAFKNSKMLDDINYSLLQQTDFIIEEISLDARINGKSHGPISLINHTDKRFWIRSKNNEPIDEDKISKIRKVFGIDLDWIGPVYHRLEDTDIDGMFCPLPNILLIKFTKNIRELEQKYLQKLEELRIVEKSEISQYLGDYHEYVVEDVEKNNAYQIKEILERDIENVESVELDIMPLIIPISMEPNDTLYDQQWNMKRIMAGGKFSSAWDFSIGNNSVVVCVIDSGCDLTHPDLQGLFAGQGVNLDTMTGNGSPILPPTTANTNMAHGTACAGITVSAFNNSLGVAGLAGGCRLLPLAFVNWTGAELARGINFASVNGANIINMSIRMNIVTSNIVNPAIQNAFNNGLLLCAATGNQNMNGINYPASNPSVMAVGATDQIDERKTPASPDGENWGSNFGNQISVVAPGVLVPTTDIQGTDGFENGDFMNEFNGTSAAKPHVSGLAALIWSLFPPLTNTQVRDRIERNTDK